MIADQVFGGPAFTLFGRGEDLGMPLDGARGKAAIDDRPVPYGAHVKQAIIGHALALPHLAVAQYIQVCGIPKMPVLQEAVKGPQRS